MCFNKRVIAGLLAIGLGILVFAPSVSGIALPLLVVAACPLSMLLMMRAMSGSREGSSCSAGTPTRSDDDEIAELRAEVQRLRAERARQLEETRVTQAPSERPV